MWRALSLKLRMLQARIPYRLEVAPFLIQEFLSSEGHILQEKRLSILVIAFWLGILSPALSAQDAPYEGKMLRIAEVLGSLHYLRNLCGETSNEWRERMDAIIAAEKPDEAERVRLVSSFNHGYRVFSDNYVRCTPSALAAIDRYMKEGESLSNELISRYGN